MVETETVLSVEHDPWTQILAKEAILVYQHPLNTANMDAYKIYFLFYVFMT